jgi:tRNA A37 methylthiotransferase MiaB
MLQEPKILITGNNCCWIAKLNAVRMKRYLQLNGYPVVGNVEDADICIATTCISMEEDVAKNFQDAHKLLSINPKVRLIFAGCGPKGVPESFEGFETLPGYDSIETMFPPRNLPYQKVNFVGQPQLRDDISTPQGQKEQLLDKIQFVLQRILSRMDPKVREAFYHYGSTDGITFANDNRYTVIISEGCNFRCSYCIIWKATGPYRSFPKEQIFAQIEDGISKGFTQFTFIYSDAASYGIDIYGKPSLKELFDEIMAKFPGIKLGFVQWSPLAFERALDGADLQKYADRIFYIRVSLQSGSPRILKKMNRPTNLEKTKKLLLKFRKYYNGLIGSDIIYGFPGETKEDIEKTIQYLIESQIDDFASFKFSPRKGTPLENEKPCKDADKHYRLLEEAKKFINLRHVHRVFSGFSGEPFAKRKMELRFRKSEIPKELKKPIQKLNWGDWRNEVDLVLSHPELPDISARLRKFPDHIALQLRLEKGQVVIE